MKARTEKQATTAIKFIKKNAHKFSKQDLILLIGLSEEYNDLQGQVVEMLRDSIAIAMSIEGVFDRADLGEEEKLVAKQVVEEFDLYRALG